MPLNKYYHILCTNGNSVVYEGRFQCPTRTAAIALLREKVGRRSLTGLVYTVTEMPIEVIREIVEAIMNKKPIPEGDIIPCIQKPNYDSGMYAGIHSYKRNPNKPQGAKEVVRRLGDF